MHEITYEKIEQIKKVLNKANFAINTLERATGNKILFSETKIDIQKLSDELQSRFPTKEKGVLNE